MIKYIIWSISFVSLYISIVWLSFLYLYQSKEQETIEKPSVNITIPAYNEEGSLKETVKSAINLNYPKSKLNITIVDDGSTDKTPQIGRKLSKKYKNVKFITKENGGKASALNKALKQTKSKLFACLDADSILHKNALKNIIHHFKNSSVAGAITAIKPYKPKTIFEKMQRLEYLVAILSRKLRAFLGTLAITPGVLSVYKKEKLEEINGFDTNNLTEDLEVALNLKDKGYNIEMEPTSITYTRVPKTFKELWQQRIRWSRGFIDNHLKYKNMFFNKKDSLMGYFQLPLNVAGVLILLIALSIGTYATITHFYEIITRTALIDNYLWTQVLTVPTLKDFLLGQNTKIMIPVILGTISSFYLFYTAHKQMNEKIKHIMPLALYFITFPYIRLLYWIGAISKEAKGEEKEW